MRLTKLFIPALACLLLLTGRTYAQPDSTIAHCSLFYVESDNQALLPFDNVCFIIHEYHIRDYRQIRVKGPINDQIDLFRDYPFAATFFLPEINSEQRLSIKLPRDWESPIQDMEPGTMFMTLSDKRDSEEYGKGPDRVDWVAVSGEIKITEFTPQGEGMRHPEFNVQMNIMLQQVDRSGPEPVVQGEKVRFKAVLTVKHTLSGD